MTRKVFHKTKSEMRGTQPSFYSEPHQSFSGMCTQQNVVHASSCNPCPPPCTPCNPCTPPCTPCKPPYYANIMCSYAPYYCFNYRNVSLWCQHCMSRRMFPEHYPSDSRFNSNQIGRAHV